MDGRGAWRDNIVVERLWRSADGFTAVLVREWATDQVLAGHDRPLDARLLVLRGGLALTRSSGPEWLGEGAHRELARVTLHAEHYGPAGCSVLVGRRYLP